uniref:Uncharacterized protein n=1 Tax=Timema tahoe TaxID=61484 RepID=A0A7R9IEG5_9NEOP|nr:unnamed protein product [Timema tahoe]
MVLGGAWRSLVNQEEKFKQQLAELNDQLTASDTERNKLLYQMEELQRDVIVKNSGVDRRGGGVGDLERINHPPVRASRVLREKRLGDISLARERTAVYKASVVPFLAYPVSTVILHTCKEAELTAAHKDSELVRKRMNRLEEDLNEFKQKNMELAEELVRKAGELH